MTKEQEEVINKLRKITNRQILYGNKFGITIEGFRELQEDIETVLNMLKENSAEIHQKNTELAEKNAEIEKLNRQIDLMAEEINETDRGYTDYCEMKIECDRNCKDCIKRYFEKQVKEKGE